MKAWTYSTTNGAVMYVETLPTNGADWSYTDQEKQAIDLTERQWRRFAADQRECGRAAFCAA